MIYTDGACSGNPGIGGWGALIIHGDGGAEELSGYEDYTTNNRMELTSAIKALEHVGQGSSVILYTDSQYVKNGITTWIHSWKHKGWMRGKADPVKNVDLWKMLDALQNHLCVEWNWVRGHGSNEGNNRADFIATEAIKRRKLELANGAKE